MKLLLYISTCLMLLSFSEPESHYGKFKEWYAKNAHLLTQVKNVDSQKYELRFLPKEVKIVRDIASKKDVDKKNLKALNEKYDAFYEFNFKISIEGVQDILVSIAENESEYNGLLFFLLEDIIRDFTLVSSEGVKQPLQCIYENNYGAAPYLSFHLVFEKQQGESLERFIYNDVLLSGGELEFDLNPINELKIPKIK